jgi:hypothetical protein
MRQFLATILDLFPKIMIVLDVCACLVYFYNGKSWHGIYWITAGVLTLCTLNMR